MPVEFLRMRPSSEILTWFLGGSDWVVTCGLLSVLGTWACVTKGGTARKEGEHHKHKCTLGAEGDGDRNHRLRNVGWVKKHAFSVPFLFGEKRHKNNADFAIPLF